MLTKNVVVHLESGISRQHELVVRDDAAYLGEVNKIADDLRNESKGAFVFTTPLGIYKLRSIIGVEFLDPLPPDKEVPLGFRPPSE